MKEEKKKKEKMTKDTVPQDFTMGLALYDAVPVIFFGVDAILMAVLLNNYIVLAGGLISMVSGLIKVLWKVIVVLKKKNVWWMYVQMRGGMPLGFLLIIIALFIGKSWSAFGNGFISMPSMVFFILGCAGMCMMGVFGACLDPSDKKSNFIEQTDNSLSQIFIFTGLLLLFF